MKKLGRFKTIGNIFKNFVEIAEFNLGFEFKNITKKSLERIAKEKEISIEDFFYLLREFRDNDIYII